MMPDEIGKELFDAIAAAAGLAWCRQHNPEKVPDLETKLESLLPQITDPNDVRRVLEISQRVG